MGMQYLLDRNGEFLLGSHGLIQHCPLDETQPAHHENQFIYSPEIPEEFLSHRCGLHPLAAIVVASAQRQRRRSRRRYRHQ
jgi:hypothetical protein